MELRPLIDGVSVAPMLEPGDMAVLSAGGVATVICNRPDAEVPPSHAMDAMRIAAEAAGLTFVANPVAMPGLTADAVDKQRAALQAAEGDAVAYCASGTRSAILWALASAGKVPTADILSRLEAAGYPMPGLGPQIDAMAARS
ncbi:TIGR01244 family sulfur transferase [Jannaschia sp. LMIT008]|uniref:TIGR01244 family sulfur transferase n=1 Tax=Jannaschia maritima TaxID=3032585 RepID=UPI00281253C9|nr:TIGR01244 family sulfur transferase [Jannaschia sp. LMIT008]